MAVGNLIFFVVTALVAVNLIFAESPQGPPPPPPPPGDNQGPPAEGGPNQEPNERFFFFTRFRGCNYTATPGATCLGCFTASTCFPSNVGTVRVCRGFLPYCNAGRCTFIPPANCTASG